MSEFVFRNLSVKLFPDAALASEPVCICCSYDYQCDDCSRCTQSPTADPCGPCTDEPTADPCGPCTDEPTDCGPCTAGPTNGCEGPTDDCFPCTEFDTGGCGLTDQPECNDSCLNETNCIDTIPIVEKEDPAGSPIAGARSPEVIKEELALLKAELRAAMGLPDESEPVPTAGPERSLEEIDRLRDALLGAVAELEQQRAEIEVNRPPE